MPRPLLLALLLAGSPLAAAEVLLDAGLDPQRWEFAPGGEFPGAAGGIGARADGQPGAVLAWDFAGGGRYVAASIRPPMPPAVTAFRLGVQADAPAALALRLGDAGGRTFQTAPIALAPGATVLALPLAGPWADAWGGGDAARLPTAPVAVTLVVRRQAVAAGSLVIERLEALSDAAADVLAEPVRLPEPLLDLLGWRVEGLWVREWRRPVLVGRCLPGPGARDGDLELRLPRQDGDLVQRLRLVAGAGAQPLRLPLPLGGNRHARHRLAVSFASEGGRSERALLLEGTASDALLLGGGQATGDLPPSRFGVATHFAQAKSEAQRGWRPFERLLDEVAACGLGWIRDGAGFAQDGAGAWQLDPRDRAWLQAARRRGLRTVVTLAMEADEPEAVRLAKVRVLAQAGELVDVIELGNEPHTFGGWRTRHGGQWNGRADANARADGSGDAPWLVAVLAATNQAAVAAKEARRAAVVIGLGSLPPANARALALGLSPAVDGIVDHPYSYTLPPELVPWSQGMAGRDGIASGDEAGTLLGLLEWYRGRGAASGRERPLWITEFGWTTFRFGLDNTAGMYAGYREEVQAAYLVRRHLLHRWGGAALSAQYDLLDDYGGEGRRDEANFGLLRADYSRKPAWYATQRLCSLFAGAEPDPRAAVAVVRAPINRAQRPGLAATWDGVDIRGPEAVIALPFQRPDLPGVRTLAVWSPLPAGTFTGRSAEIRIGGWPGFGDPLAIGLVSGRITEVPHRRAGNDLLLSLHLDDEPLAVRLFAEYTP